MQKTEFPPTKHNPSLLLVEPDSLGFSERASQLGRAFFNVTRADTALHIYRLKGVCDFSVAVLSDRVGLLALRASAQIVRAQWPKARILVLGKAPSHFDDNLYDESALHTSSNVALVATINKVSATLWNERGGSLSAWTERASLSPRLQESNPTKIPIGATTRQNERDWPAGEQVSR